MKQIWELESRAFEKMLEWLDKDREIAGQKYEAIRRRLIKILTRRGCLDGESLADETIDRVTRKIDFLTDTYQGDPVHYFLNVANKIYLEYLRKPVSVELSDSLIEKPAGFSDEEDFKAEFDCLSKCLERLPGDKREFIVNYYQEDKKRKMDFLKKVAESSGVELSSLHMRAFRLRSSLQKCVVKCLGKSGK